MNKDRWAVLPMDNRPGMQGLWERNIPDETLVQVWAEMCQRGVERTFFFTGHVRTALDWLAWIKNPTNHPFFVFDLETEPAPICFFAVLNRVEGRTAQGHFCPVGQYRSGSGEAVIEFLAELRDMAGQPLIRLLWGGMPATNTRAIALTQHWGMSVLGTLPHWTETVDGDSVAATLVYLDMEVYRNGSTMDDARSVRVDGGSSPR